MKPKVVYGPCPCIGRENILDASYQKFEFKTKAEVLDFWYGHSRRGLYLCIHLKGRGCLSGVFDGSCPTHCPPNYPDDSCNCPIRTAHIK